jgi:tetratricopeptide (TPR) repeat protein
MTMHPETTNRTAFTLFTQAQDQIRKYNEFKELGEPAVANEILASAADSLNKALAEDPRYLGALYFRGVVDDLRGRAGDAVKDLTRVLEAVEKFVTDYGKCWPTVEQVKYNLAVAYYHRYGHPNLEKAAGYFQEVIEATKKNQDRRLPLLSKAGLAQAYAMRMIPKLPTGGTYEEFVAHLRSTAVEKDVEEYFELSKAQSDSALQELKELQADPKKRSELGDAANEIGWIAYNARAIALMYYTDFHDDGRMEKLKGALDALKEAETRSPENWSLYCNVGSANMRLGHWSQVEAEAGGQAQGVLTAEAKKHFDEAESRLTKVVDVLLPEYGFALYELGRNCRLMYRFNEARTWLERSGKIDVAQRAVSNERLTLESTRAHLSLTDYP